MSVKYLESAENVKTVLNKSIGKNISTNLALEISSCITQGNKFFDIAKSSPMIIKPLLIFYGMSSLAKAIVLSRNHQKLASLKRSHGLSDITADSASITQMKIKINTSGTFSEFNDVISKLECVTYNTQMKRVDTFIPTSTSTGISNLEISIDEIWSRCTQLGTLYKQTFQEKPNSIPMSFGIGYNGEEEKFLDIIPATECQNINEVKDLTESLRHEHPFLRKLCLVEACLESGCTHLKFGNFSPDENEFPRLSNIQSNVFEYRPKYPKEYSDVHEIINAEKFLPPLSGGIGMTTQRYIKPIHGRHISEWSLIYMGAFSLSSYCRYKPHNWTHALQSRVTQTRRLDDKSIAFIEAFLKHITGEFPHFVDNAINIVKAEKNNVTRRALGNYWL